MTVEMSRLLQKLNIRLNSNGMYVPISENGDWKVHKFIEGLNEAKFIRSKTPNANEYYYTWTKGESEVVICHRYGKGYAAIISIKTPV